MGLKNPILAWVLAPLVVFLVISILFKFAGLMVHQKVDVHFKYHAGDLRLALWERLSRRLGLCLALVNGAVYLILISFVIYTFGYWTVQMASDDKDPKTGKDSQSARPKTYRALVLPRWPGRSTLCRWYGMTLPTWRASFTTTP